MFKDKTNQNIVVFKIGGSVLAEITTYKLDSFIDTVFNLIAAGIRPIIVHGAGPQLNRKLAAVNIEANFISGYRYTSPTMMQYVQQVFMSINKDLVFNFNKKYPIAIGLSGYDAGLIIAKKITKLAGKSIDLGEVGEIVRINKSLLTLLINNGYLPIISSFGCSKREEKLNLNADLVAGYISGELQAAKLVIISDIPGVYKNWPKKDKIYSQLKLLEAKKIRDKSQTGMLPKLTAAINAVENGTLEVLITDAVGSDLTNALLNKIPLGTIIK